MTLQSQVIHVKITIIDVDKKILNLIKEHDIVEIVASPGRKPEVRRMKIIVDSTR